MYKPIVAQKVKASSIIYGVFTKLFFLSVIINTFLLIGCLFLVSEKCDFHTLLGYLNTLYVNKGHKCSSQTA
jgi:hypothetical protein